MPRKAERFAGWRDGVSSAGINVDESCIFRAEDSYKTGMAMGPDLVSKGFDAVVCVSDTFALGIMAGLSRAGLTPGKDLAVVGFDDIAAAALVEPGLSSIHQPMAKVGEVLVAQLARVLAGKPPEKSQALIAPSLVQRGSTAG